jgi:hypothetical protein
MRRNWQAYGSRGSGEAEASWRIRAPSRRLSPAPGGFYHPNAFGCGLAPPLDRADQCLPHVRRAFGDLDACVP